MTAGRRYLDSDVAEASTGVVAASQRRYLDPIDRACLVIAVVLVSICLTVALLLNKYTSDWRFVSSAGISSVFVCIGTVMKKCPVLSAFRLVSK